jgi:hypothetical protein
VVAVVALGSIAALWTAIGFGGLYDRIGNQLFLSRRSAARPRHAITRPSRQLRAIEAALEAPARRRMPGASRRARCLR